MHTFKDSTGYEWRVTLSLGAAMRIEASDLSAVYEGKINLLNIEAADPRFMTEGMMNTGLLACLAFICCKEQVEEIGISQEEFCERITSNEKDAMREAVWEEVASFHPEFRTYLQNLKSTFVRTSEEIARKLSHPGFKAALDSQVDSILTGMGQELDKALIPANGPGNSSGQSPDP